MRSTPHLCAEPFCSVVLDAPGRCAEHGSRWDHWRATPEGRRRSRGYGSRWTKVRDAYIAEHPLCEVCGEAASAEVNHKDGRTPLDPGANEWSNLEALCLPCHRRAPARRRREAARRDR
jgi:5-methylcytosine-specific restriction protein A